MIWKELKINNERLRLSSSDIMKEGKKYSMICEFRGGTFISQISSKTEQDAFFIWIKNQIEQKEDIIFTKEDKFVLSKEIDFDIHYPVLLQNLKNIWSADFSLRDEYVSLVIVKTCEE